MAGGPTPGFMPAGRPSDLNPNNGSGPLGTEVSNVLYRALFGPTSHPHDGSFGATAESFNPLHRAGLLNLAAMFVGGPKGDATPMLESLDMKGQFAPYSHETGSALDRGVVNEGPIRPGKGYNPSMQKMVERAHTNPFLRAPREIAAREAQNAMEKQSALELARQSAARAQAARSQIDHQINAAPMAGKVGHGYQEHDAALVHGPSVIGHPNFLKAMLQRRYVASLGHNHLN